MIQVKTFKFSLRIVRLSRHLNEKKSEYVLAKQVLRSGTSVGANVEEAIGGSTKKDFLYKMSIAYREARETKYWLRLLMGSDYLEPELATSLLNDCEEILKILGSIQKTVKSN
ncbi:MAG: four helix bundle protein [Balneolales bacterium]